MKKEKQFSDYRKLSIQDIVDLCESSPSSAKRLKQEIRRDLGIKTKYIFFFQFRAYFCQIPIN